MVKSLPIVLRKILGQNALKLKFDAAKDMPIQYNNIINGLQPGLKNVNFKILEKKRENDVFKQGAGQGTSKQGMMVEFLETKQKLLSSSKKMAYLQDHNLNPRYPRLSDFDRTNLISSILKKKDLKLTIWSHFTRTPQKAEFEEFKCVLKGQEQFKLVSPIFR